MARPRFGFTYPTVTGENQTEAFRRVLSEFPDLQLWSHYYDGVPDWGAAWFQEAPSDAVFLLSTKTSDINALAGRIATMPIGLRGRVWIFLHHEPDQWRSTSDRRGDPDPAVWQQRQLDFAALRANATWRDWIQHWACFTEDRLRTARDFWMQHWGQWMLDNASIFDGVAWDVFNIGRSIVRTGGDMFQNVCQFNRDGGWPIAIREWGQVTPVDSPEDSLEVAEGVRDHYNWMKSNATDLAPVMVWYYNHNNTLVDPSGQRPGRPLTRAALEEIMAEARTLEEEPDPCCAQVAELEAQVAALQAQVDALQAQVDAIPGQLQTAHAEGMAEGRAQAFAEVVAWAQAQG
jgi:outer membrane murein-binding lipoprotein Lpp